MRHLSTFWFVLLGLLLVSCNPTSNSPQPLVVVASPNAPDTGFRTYDHPSGAFSIRVPPAWIPDTLPDENGIRMQFTSVEGEERVVRLSIYVVNTGQPLTQEVFLQTVNTYQPPPDVSSIPWTPLGEPIAMVDGSMRLAGVRYYPMLGARALNIFFQGNGSYFSALEVDVTSADPTLTQTLMAAVNTYRINTNAPLNVGQVMAGGVVSEVGVIAFQNYTHWQDSNGGFNITGQIVNRAEEPFEAVRLTAYLFDADGNQLAERSDVLAYDVLAGGETAPFRIRFDTGRPSTAVRYELHAAARAAGFSLSTFYGKENFLFAEDRTNYNDSGFLVVSGLLQNNGSRLATSIKVIVTIYGENGEVVATESSFINQDQLLPGEATRFEVTIYDFTGDPLRFELGAQGVVQ